MDLIFLATEISSVVAESCCWFLDLLFQAFFRSLVVFGLWPYYIEAYFTVGIFI